MTLASLLSESQIIPAMAAADLGNPDSVRALLALLGTLLILCRLHITH